METNDTTFTISNDQIALTIDSFGGAFLTFYLKRHHVNPLTFRLDNEDRSGRGGFRGHFVCLGRWGDATEGERLTGLPKHGDACRLPWSTAIAHDGRAVAMAVSSNREGLRMQRHVNLLPGSAVVQVCETVTNLRAVGRFYQVVQHPTFATPFLDRDVLLFCNASRGFNQVFNAKPETHALHWPYAYREDESMMKLNRFDEPCNGVFSYVVEPTDAYGWAVVYSRKSRLLMGYIWPREHYPWINIWQEWSGRKPLYLGVEFGTTGLHKPFPEVIEEGNTRVFGERTYAFVDAGASQRFCYHMFLHRVAEPLQGVEYVAIKEGILVASLNGRERVLHAVTG